MGGFTGKRMREGSKLRELAEADVKAGGTGIRLELYYTMLHYIVLRYIIYFILLYVILRYNGRFAVLSRFFGG